MAHPNGKVSQPEYERSRKSSSASLIFKPVSQLNTYDTYMEGLEHGGISSSTNANLIAITPSMQSKQKEIWVKVSVYTSDIAGQIPWKDICDC
ncbi:MAG: hypothetical protein Q7T66_06640 [Herminiimonas sp.]|uniref:hypothetical protein n=1 Tax=Herminiimonas sp. TaxID=1926289 RepID=UPI002715B3CC|nr:hypothetical protein [Herminiimonas sp.]MDO9420320.1 hypothetical protein [Herminiimonas sp.]